MCVLSLATKFIVKCRNINMKHFAASVDIYFQLSLWLAKFVVESGAGE